MAYRLEVFQIQAFLSKIGGSSCYEEICSESTIGLPDAMVRSRINLELLDLPGCRRSHALYLGRKHIISFSL